MKSSAKASRILIFALALFMAFSLCSCNVNITSNTSESQTSSNETLDPPEKYEYEDISVASITAVVGNKAYDGFSINSSTLNGVTAKKITYSYKNVSASDIEAYGEYLLQNGFEEIQTNIFSKSMQEGVTMKITLDGESVTVDGAKK
ncbi:MAG: hypothetical protein ACI4F6_05430 [Acutalibacteraceae bacterium]